MKIYIAGFYINALSGENKHILPQMRPDHVLESYHYIGNGRFNAAIRESGKPIFLDSGAFSMFTQGVKVDIQSYGDFILQNQDMIHIASNLDDVTKTPELSYQNQKILEGMGCKVQPVFHTREDPTWLQRYLDAGYDYIFLGGMVPESTPWLREWLDDLWQRYLTNADGTPKVKVHGFGLTVLDLMFRYPWHSVDSTSWVMTTSMGGVFLDLPHRDVKVMVSDRSPKQKELDAHFDTLPPAMQRQVEARVEELGYRMQDLRTNYAWRNAWNIQYFERIQSRGVSRLPSLQKGLFDA